MISSLEALVPWLSTSFLCRMARDSLNNSEIILCFFCCLTLSVADCCNVSIILTGKQNGQFQFLSTVVTRMAVT